MKIGQMFSGNYLKAADLDDELLVVTIENVEAVSLRDNSGSEVIKPVLHFNGMESGLVLNKTNANMVCKALGSDDTDDWVGRKITLYVAEVEFRGDVVPAIRVKSKPPGGTKKKREKPPSEATDVDLDDIPF